MNGSDFLCGSCNGVVVMPAGLRLEILQEATTVEAQNHKTTGKVVGTRFMDARMPLAHWMVIRRLAANRRSC